MIIDRSSNIYDEEIPLEFPIHYVPRWYQVEVHQAFAMGYKHFLLLWHRKTGKEFTCVNITFEQMIKVVGVYYYFFPKYTQGRKVLWEGKCDQGIRFLDRMPKKLIHRLNNHEMYMELTNGSVMRVVGADKKSVDNIIGVGPQGVVYSEFGVGDHYQLVKDRFTPVLQNNNGWEMLNGTTRGRNHYYRQYKAAINMPETWFVSSLQTIAPDYPTGRYTGIISPEKLQESLKGGMDENEFHQENGISFAAGVRGAIFGKQISKALSQGRVSDFPIDSHAWVETLWDLGHDDMTTIWFLQRLNGKTYFIDYYQWNHEDWNFYVNILQKKGYNYRTHHIPHDGGNTYPMLKTTPIKVFKEVLKESGVGGKVLKHDRPTDKTLLYSGTKRKFDNFYFHETNCEKGIILIENYRKKYDIVTKTWSQKPIHDESSHCCDSLMLESIIKNPVLYTGQNKSNGLIVANQLRSKAGKTRLDRFNII